MCRILTTLLESGKQAELIMERNPAAWPASWLAKAAPHFAKSAFTAGSPVPDWRHKPRWGAATKRIDVYRNNVIVSLIDALAAVFAVV